jgi:hypothetical protein
MVGKYVLYRWLSRVSNRHPATAACAQYTVEVWQRRGLGAAAAAVRQERLAGQERSLIWQRGPQVELGSASSRSSIVANPIDTSA